MLFKKRIKNLSNTLLALVFSNVLYQPVLARDFMDERVEFSGFARIVAGYLDEEAASFEGYDDNISLSEQSLLGLQADIHLTDTLTVATQLLAHSSEERKSGIEWLYLNYEPDQYWRIKAGKLRTPFLQYSDVLDVGFAYSWISPPQQLYSSYLFSNFDGLSVTHRNTFADLNIDIEAYWGTYDDSVFVGGDEVNIEVDEILGLIFQVQHDNLQVRAAYAESNEFFADFLGLEDLAVVLERAGFQQSADSLRFDGSANSYQVGVRYDDLDYFASAEWFRIEADLLVVPSVDGYYLTAGINLLPFQLHLTYASAAPEYAVSQNEIPRGIAPQLDQLALGYDQVIDSLPSDSLDSYTLGARWNMRANLAFKVEFTRLVGDRDARSFFDVADNAQFDRRANLYQVAVEWVF